MFFALRKRIRQACISKPRLLWRRYVIGFLIIFATISVSHWASLAKIKAADDDAEVLSISSRQRMLSQRILFLMNEVERGNIPDIEYRLEAALDLFEQSHNWLVERAELSPELHDHYFENGPITLDAFSRRFVVMVGIASNATGAQREELYEIVAGWGREDLIMSLAKAAALFRENSEARIETLHQIQKITLITALVVLLFEALLIFAPAQMSVNAAIDRLEKRKSILKKSLAALKERNAELEHARTSLAKAANQDALTGLFNRRAVYEKLTSPEEDAHGGDCTLCVMKLDLDHFKEVNDTLGHNAGDQVLVHVAEVLKKRINEECFAGRIGGDEFVFLMLRPPSLEMIVQVADSIISEISRPLVIDQKQCQVGASVGFTIATSSGATPDQMLIEADLALYEAKRAGRGAACAYSDALAADIETRRVLFEEINCALTEDQFEPYLQPQVYTDTGEIYGCEVLARWRHPDRGIVPPATFIAAAEEAGLVDQIDRMMIEKGLNLLEYFDSIGIVLPSISVNASPQTLRDPHLVDRLKQEVMARHLAPERLTVEVLESTLIENDDDIALRTIENLATVGFSVVLDDFGTGYASMSNLSRLRLNGIKLDQSLIKPVPDPRADSIIEALVTLSRNLNMRVVAEGVETEGHFDTVRRLGCDVVQGYGISRPMEASKFPDWFQTYVTSPDTLPKRA